MEVLAQHDGTTTEDQFCDWGFLSILVNSQLMTKAVVCAFLSVEIKGHFMLMGKSAASLKDY